MDFRDLLGGLLDLLGTEELALLGSVLVIGLVCFTLGYLVGVLRNG